MTVTDTFDPFSSAAVEDPYPFYEHLRDDAPVAWLPELNAWFVARYDDVARVLHDPTTFSSAAGMGSLVSGRVGRRRVDAREMLGIDLRQLRVLIASDPPDHTRLRRLLSRAFTPRTIGDLEPHLRTICTELVDSLVDAAEDGSGDLIEHVAVPFPVIVIAELLGVPPEMRHDFKRWSNALVGTLGGQANPAESVPVLAEMFMFISQVVEERRITPGTDMISVLVAGSDADDPDALSSMEIALFAILLLVAGNETTTNLVGNLFNALHQHPDQAARLYDDPTLIPATVEETLRWDGPVQGLFRAPTEAATVRGIEIGAGDTMLISFASANRDRHHFTNPDQFDIDRGTVDHLAFGHGIHHCLGAALARLEARIVTDTIVGRGIHLEPSGGATRTSSPILRGFATYPVTVTQRGR